MKKALNIGAQTRMAVLIAVFLTVALCVHAGTVISSTWDSGLDGWVASGAALVTNTSGFVEVNFPKQTAPAFSSESITKYIAAGYRPSHISFRFRAPELMPSVIRVYLESSSGRSWYMAFNLTDTNEWVRFNVIVDFNSGWILGPVSIKDDFEVDMNTITRVSVQLVRNGDNKAHAFYIDDFVVDAVQVGNPIPVDGDKDGMLDSWEVANGLDPENAADADEDVDGDGLSNGHEYVAGTDPQDPSSTLKLSAPEDLNLEPGVFTLSWPSVAGKNYGVWKSTNLVSGFYLLEGGIGATPPVNFYMDDISENDRSLFYRIEVE